MGLEGRRGELRVDDVIPGKMSWEFEDFEKRVSLRSTVEGSGWVFRIWSDQILFLGFRPAEMNWDLTYHKIRRVSGRQFCMVSSGFYDLCLSSRQGLKVERNKLVRTTCICINVVSDIFMRIQQHLQ